MDADIEERIRKRAYELWEDASKPYGGSEAFWLQAERELLGDPNPERAAPNSVVPEEGQVHHPAPATSARARIADATHFIRVRPPLP
jgi:hypothetical protein